MTVAEPIGTVRTWSRAPPLAAAALASILEVPLTVDLDEKGKGMPETLDVSGGPSVTGTPAVCKFIARSASNRAKGLAMVRRVGD